MSQVVDLEFHLNEGVSPEFLAKRVAEACGAYFALRPGEAVVLRNPDSPRNSISFTITGTNVCEASLQSEDRLHVVP